MEGKNEIKQSRRRLQPVGEDCGNSRNPPPLRKSRELIDGSSVHLNQDMAANAEHYVPIHSVLSTKEMMTCTVPEGGHVLVIRVHIYTCVSTVGSLD